MSNESTSYNDRVGRLDFSENLRVWSARNPESGFSEVTEDERAEEEKEKKE